MSSDADTVFMREAIALARMGYGSTKPNPLVGAVIVKDGHIVGRGFHARAGEAHAEVNALADAAAHGRDIAGATLYVTLEPCSTTGRTPPCTDAIMKSGISRVVIGSNDPNPLHSGRARGILEAAGIEVVTGVEAQSAGELNYPFFKWIVSGRPFVILKMAMTLDGKSATADGSSQWITGVEARSRVQQLRRLAGAILIGSRTLRADHPRLNVREPENWPMQPLRLVASSKMTAHELNSFFPDGNAELVRLNDAASWDKLLVSLGKRAINCLLIEGGGELADSAIEAGAVDYVEFHIAPRLLGGRGSRPVLGGANPVSLKLAKQLHRVKTVRYGDDIAVSGFLE
ncbi:MAG: bifunctional diaminohydroxyphosphoribosylaminopyrimidine deaminase/5-amino-6-(5-phosphoribosylamino)uracil reductase RibD [Victivallaceae bacterium]|nr:bifunctional diaminohydroxyphosphoribosylaminopyrimidine deaminase/5-amino-6-(5-phosphoribosylamino)uracil reductase RibD [Victivallaceae bacterium]